MEKVSISASTGGCRRASDGGFRSPHFRSFRRRRRQQRQDLRQHGTSSTLPGGNEFGGAIEAVVAEAADIGLDPHIGLREPAITHRFLCDGKALANDIEDVTRPLQISPVRTEMDGKYAIGSHLAKRLSGNRVREHAIDKL